MALDFLILAVTCIIALAYYYVNRQYNYWKVRGVPFLKPEFPIGSVGGAARKYTFGENWQKHYNALKKKGPIGGVFIFTSPAVLALDLDFLRNVFVKDFAYFHDRGTFVNERDDPLSANMFNLEGAKWKTMRSKLSPTFTSGKMKMMFPTMLDVVTKFHEHLDSVTKGGRSEVEMKELLAQFTTDMISSTAFGVEVNTMKDPENEFRVIGRKVFESSPVRTLKLNFLLTFPRIGRFLRMCLIADGVTPFYMNLLRETVKYREENKVHRNDFLQLLMQIKDTGKLEDGGEDLGKMTFNELVAQVFLFFVAGFETSSSTMTFAFYEMAINQHVQDKAREEVKEVLERHNGEFTYEALMEMTYIDQIINETLRMYPIVHTLTRNVNMAYKVPNTDVILEKDTRVLIPVYGIQRDPEIYPEPEKFDPDRFTKENIAARHPYSWMPFGLGPRNCVGMRFGLMQTRLGIAMVLKNFMVTPSEKTPIPMRFDPKGIFLTVQGGMHLNVTPLS